MHADLRLAGTLPPLDAPHHMRATEWSKYREGVVTKSVLGEGSLLNVGLEQVSSSQVLQLLHAVLLAVAAISAVLHPSQHDQRTFVCTGLMLGMQLSPVVWP